jgi:hypothetical protein
MLVSDCDPGDKQYITNATALQSELFEIRKTPTKQALSGYIGICWSNLCDEKLQRLCKVDCDISREFF